MSMNLKRQKHLKKKIAAVFLLLVILGVSAFFFNTFFISSKPLFISPIGKVNNNAEKVKEILKKNNISFSEVTSSDNLCIINISNNGQVKISLDKDINQQISSLQRILKELTIEGKSFKDIDFRFEEPVISF